MATSVLLNSNEQKIIETLRSNSKLENCILEMIDITQVSLGELDNGDDAEEAVISSTQKIRELLLKQWAQKKSDEAADKVRLKQM